MGKELDCINKKEEKLIVERINQIVKSDEVKEKLVSLQFKRLKDFDVSKISEEILDSIRGWFG